MTLISEKMFELSVILVLVRDWGYVLECKSKACEIFYLIKFISHKDYAKVFIFEKHNKVIFNKFRSF